MKLTLIIIAAVIIVPALLIAFQNMKTPTHLGHKDGKLAPMPSKPNAVSSQSLQDDKKVQTLPFKGDASQTLAALTKVLATMANNEVKVSDGNYIYSVFTTAKMKYHDDVELLLDEDQQVVHFRSQSRAGYSDMGVNRKRYNKFRTLYSM